MLKGACKVIIQGFISHTLAEPQGMLMALKKDNIARREGQMASYKSLHDY